MFIHYQNNFKISNRRDANIFIQDILFIGECYLKFLVSKNIIYLPEYINAKDAAVDLLSELFKTENDIFVKFQYFFNNNFAEEPIIEEKEYDNYLRGFIYTVIQNNLTKVYKESDPFTYNICRNIKEAVKNLDFSISIHFSDKYIQSDNNIDFNLDVIDRDDLITLIYKYDLNKLIHSIPAFLKSIFNMLNKETGICKALKFYDLVFAIKSVLSKEFLGNNGKASDKELISEEINLKFILDDIRYSYSEKLSKYISKNDLSQNFYECMYNIIDDIIAEYKNGNSRNSVMNLMKRYFKSEDKNLFYKVQYCIELFENEIVKNIKTEHNLIGR